MPEIIDVLNNILWETVVRDVQALGEIILKPDNFDRPMRLNKLGYTDSTILFLSALTDRIPIDPLLSMARKFLNYLYNAVNENNYEDARTLIENSELYRIVKFYQPSSGIAMFPNDAIPILKDFIKDHLF